MVTDIGIIGAALCMGMSVIGYGKAISAGLPAVAGMIAEDETKFGKGIVLLAMTETALVFGLLVSVIILFVV